MLTYILRERRFQYKDGILPRFPNTAIVIVRLEPPVPFGGVAGPSRSAAKDILIAKANLSKGTLLFDLTKPLFEPLDSSIDVLNTTFDIKGNIASVKFHCKSEKDLAYFFAALFYAFPAVLNVYILDAPFPIYAWGSVGKAEFHWLFEPTEVRGGIKITNKEMQENYVTDSWKKVATVTASNRLMGGLHYFHAACRLLEAGYNRFEFMAEALLNFSKSLQSLFGESNDEIRAELKKLKIFTNDEIEAKFITAMILRSKFDVAHASLSPLSRDQFKTLHKYTNIVEDAFRKLFEGLFEKIEKKEYTLPPEVKPILKKEKEKKKILKKIGRNIKQFE